jgi:hypothetical protein
MEDVILVIVSDLHFTDGASGEALRSGAFRLFRDELSNLAYGASWRANGQYKPVEDVSATGCLLSFCVQEVPI